MRRKLPPKTYIYFLAQSINLTVAVMSVTMAAAVGITLAPSSWMSTIPYGFQFLFVMIMTYPASRIMSIIGRKKSFLFASIPLMLGGVTGFLAIEKNIFYLLIVAHSLLGVYIAFANFYRFAATDNITSALKPKAISLVVAGGVIAAFVGPELASYLKELDGYQEFSICYLSFCCLAFISFLLNSIPKEKFIRNIKLDVTKPSRASLDIIKILKNKNIITAILVASIGYGVMNLLMVQTTIHMSDIDINFEPINNSIRWHVLAMFLPSFFSGFIIDKVGLKVSIILGIFLLIISGLMNIEFNGYHSLTASLIVLGLGWNFTYVGGSSFLAESLEGLSSTSISIKIQGINDLGISIMATVGAFMPALLQVWLGWKRTNLLSIGLCVVLLTVVIIVFSKKNIVTVNQRASL